eukprot:764414-Hanusia_phi.AAC.2
MRRALTLSSSQDFVLPPFEEEGNPGGSAEEGQEEVRARSAARPCARLPSGEQRACGLMQKVDSHDSEAKDAARKKQEEKKKNAPAKKAAPAGNKMDVKGTKGGANLKPARQSAPGKQGAR